MTTRMTTPGTGRTAGRTTRPAATARAAGCGIRDPGIRGIGATRIRATRIRDITHISYTGIRDTRSGDAGTAPLSVPAAAGDPPRRMRPAAPTALSPSPEEGRMLQADARNPRPPRPPIPGPDAPAGRPADTPVPNLDGLALPELRTLRRDAQQEEADLSYLRRLLQGRIDILRAELARRTAPGPCPPPAEVPGTPPAAPAGEPEGAVLDRLPEILADGPSRVRSARHVTLGPPHSEECRLLADQMLADVELSDLEARTDHELGEAMGRLVRHEQDVSQRRRRLQATVDGCSAEIARRYREGEARVDDLLAGG